MDRAQMTTQSINDLPDSAFAYIEPGGSKDSEGKTVPRSLRHFPIHDAAHVRNALARAPQSPFGEKAMPAIRAAAKKFGIDVASSNRYLAPSAVYERYSATVTDVNQMQRIIDVIAVPWNQDSAEPVPFEDGMYRERFIPGAFDHLTGSIGRIAVNTGHDQTALVGKVAAVQPRDPQGLRGALKIAKTERGDEVLQLATEDMLSPSIGYYTRQGGYRKSRRLGTVEIRWAGLDHIALVGVPAYAGAVIDGIRATSAPATPTVAATPLLDEFLHDPVVQWAEARVPRGRE